MPHDDRPMGRRLYSFWIKATCSILATFLFRSRALAYAQDDPPSSESDSPYLATDAELDPDFIEIDGLERANRPDLADVDLQELRPDRTPEEAPDDITPIALPGGEEGASAVTPQSISLPNAEGSIEGMGESFSPVLSSGTATFSVPIAVAPGRAGVQPSLALSYATTRRPSNEPPVHAPMAHALQLR